MKKVIFEEDSVVQHDTDIDAFVPPHPGWNYVSITNHPKDKYIYERDVCGKWLIFVPTEEFVWAFRELAKLAKSLRLTHSFKASGRPAENGEHVFCVYCGNSSKTSFVRQIADTLTDEGFLDKYGFQYRNGTKALFYKTDTATHYKSQARGMSLTLYRFTDKKELFVKEFNDGTPNWRLVTSDENPSIMDSFNMHLSSLEMDRSMDYDD